jgi:transcriptional regulator with XRE-family HTH domain
MGGMMDTPPLWRLMTGSALRRYREGMGYALEDAAKILDCCPSKISRVETGQRGIRPKELRELLSDYGVTPLEQATLLQLAQLGRNQHSEVTTCPPDRDIWLAASQILLYDALQVPMLLQTPEYAREIGAADGSPSAGVVPRVTAVVSEGALRQMVGGAEVMHAQLSALAATEAVVQVLPFSSGARAAGCGVGSLAFLRFGEAPALDVVRVGGQYLLGDADLACYLDLFEQLQASALSPAASAQMLRGMAGTLGA